MEMDFEDRDLVGIKGWLIFVAIGVVIAPFRIIGGFLMIYGPLLTEGTWRYLVTPGSEAYSPYWVPLLAFEITFNIAMGAAAIWLAVLFFTHHRYFPTLYIVIMLVSLIGIPFDAWLVSLVVPESVAVDESVIGDFFRTLIASAIWIPYMLKSLRVKATFVR